MRAGRATTDAAARLAAHGRREHRVGGPSGGPPWPPRRRVGSLVGVARLYPGPHARHRARPGRQPLQAPGLRLPLGRDLRRLPVHLRLRPARRPACCATSRTPGGARWCSCATTWSASTPPSSSPPAIWEAAGHLANFTDPLVDCRNCHEPLPRSTSSTTRASARSCGSTDSFTEARAVQPHVQDPRRPGRGGRRRRLPAARDGPGHVRQLRQRAADDPQEAAVRHRPGGQDASATRSRRRTSIFRTREFEQMEMEFFVPPAEAPQWFEYWRDERLRWYSTSASPHDLLRLRPHEADELSHYSAGTSDVEFLFPWGWDELEGIANRTDYDLTQHAKRVGRAARVLRPGHRRALRALRHRAGGRRHPDHDGLPARRLRRGRGRRRVPHGAAPPPPARALPGGGAAAVEEGHAHAAGQGGASACSPPLDGATTTTPSRSAAATAARTRSARRWRVTVDFDSLEDRRRHRPRPGHDRAGAGADRALAGAILVRLRC